MNVTTTAQVKDLPRTYASTVATKAPDAVGQDCFAPTGLNLLDTAAVLKQSAPTQVVVTPGGPELLDITIPSAALPIELRNLDTRLLTYKAGRGELKKSLEARGISLWAIRHGQSEMNASQVPLTSGQIETPLTEKGKEQARLAAERLYTELGGLEWVKDLVSQRQNMPAVYASTLSRAQHTAQVFVDYVAEQAKSVGLNLELPIQTDSRILEMNFGKYEGRPDADSLINHPSLWSNAEFSQRCPQGESRVDVMERLSSFLDSVRGRHQNQPVLMFCHLMPTALTQILLGDGPVDEKGCLFINRADFPNAVPRQLTRPTTSPQLEYLIA